MSKFDNKLLDAIPRRQRGRLLMSGHPVKLSAGQVLWVPEQEISHAYFPTTASISLMSVVDGEHMLEVGMVGREGFVGVALTQGSHLASLRAVVLGDGIAWQIDVVSLRREMTQHVGLRSVINRYLAVRMRQLERSAACARFHLVGARLARWLLMSHDRASEESFILTHQTLAHMLGVRRVGITLAAGLLQSSGFIVYSRGTITVKDRRGLEKASCSCYSNDRAVYAASFK